MHETTPEIVQEKAPRFSIVINLYNGERYIATAIESVLSQSYDDWELICWDDRSTDASAEVCKRYKDPRIRYILSPDHTFLGKARDLAIREARGEWIAFLDQDDYWTPTKLADQNRLIEEDTTGKLGLLYGRTMCFDLKGRKWDFDRWHEFSTLPEGDVFKELITKASFISLSSSVLLRAAVEKLDGIPDEIQYCGDYYLFVMVARDYHAACLQEPCCWYRIHDSNMSALSKIQIHLEGLDIIGRCSDRIDRRTRRQRERVHNTRIGIEEIVSRKALMQGAKRILLEGSLPYLLGFPLLNLFRSIRRFIHRQDTPPP